ncbi:MAG: molybdopterin-dependent oxidoreductase [Blastococcus sp.]
MSADTTGLGLARVAAPGEAIGLDELALATRNHGMPLEALRYDVTPPGLHYVLTHYDIPAVDPSGWVLEIGGAVARPLRLGLDELMARPAVTSRVLLECAGNGRARFEPRPVSQPWLLEAVGSAEWTGTPLAPLLEEAGVSDGAVDVVFTGADHGLERGVEQDYARGLALADALRPETLLAWAMNGVPLPPQHGAPLPGWYGMAQVKWLQRIEVLDRPFDGFQNATAYRMKADLDDDGEPVTRIRPRAARTTGLARLHDPGAVRAPRDGPAHRPGVVGSCAGHPRRGEHGRRRHLVRRRACAGRPEAPLRLAGLELRVDGVARARRAAGPGERRRGRQPAGRAGVEPAGHGQQRRPAGAGDRAGLAVRRGVRLLLDDDRAQPRPQDEPPRRSRP